MLASFFNAEHTLRNRFHSLKRRDQLRDYTRLDDTPDRREHQNANGDSVCLEARGKSNPNFTTREHLNRETIAYCAVLPGRSKVATAHEMSFEALLDEDSSIRMIASRDDGNYARAKYIDVYRNFEVEARRDSSGSAEFHMYAPAHDPLKDSDLHGLSRRAIERHIRNKIYGVCNPVPLFDAHGNAVTDNYTIVQIYNPKLAVAENRHIETEAHLRPIREAERQRSLAVYNQWLADQAKKDAAPNSIAPQTHQCC